MMTYQEINEFLMSFNINSYNRTQIGNDKKMIITVYEFLKKLNIKRENINIIIENIAYLNKVNTNISLYLELLSKSLGFAHVYDKKEVLKTIKEIHDIYFRSSALVPLEEYIHDTSDERIKKLFLNRNNKYLIKNFESKESISAIGDIKLASAIVLEKKEYKDFISYIDELEKVQDFYSPLLAFKTYSKVRKQLKVNKRLFWDVLFGNEYVVALTKHNIPIKDIYKKNIYGNYKFKESNRNVAIQLDLFGLNAETECDKQYLTEDLSVFQICTIYNSNNLPDYTKEQDLLMYYKKLIEGKETIILPKLKKNHIASFQYNLN